MILSSQGDVGGIGLPRARHCSTGDFDAVYLQAQLWSPASRGTNADRIPDHFIRLTGALGRQAWAQVKPLTLMASCQSHYDTRDIYCGKLRNFKYETEVHS